MNFMHLIAQLREALTDRQRPKAIIMYKMILSDRIVAMLQFQTACAQCLTVHMTVLVVL